MVSALAYDMGYFEPQERRTQQLTARIPKSVADGLEDLAKIWTHIEQVRTGDKEARVTVSDVVVRLLQVGLNGAWGEIGFHPKTKEQWAEVYARGEKLFGSDTPPKK